MTPNTPMHPHTFKDNNSYVQHHGTTQQGHHEHQMRPNHQSSPFYWSSPEYAEYSPGHHYDPYMNDTYARRVDESYELQRYVASSTYVPLSPVAFQPGMPTMVLEEPRAMTRFNSAPRQPKRKKGTRPSSIQIPHVLQNTYPMTMYPHSSPLEGSWSSPQQQSPKSKTVVNSSRRRTVLETCTCTGPCGRPISLAYMRGIMSALEKTYLIQIYCKECSDANMAAEIIENSFNEAVARSPSLNSSFSQSLPNIDETFVATTRKRSRDAMAVVQCEVCRHNIGIGGIKPLNAADYTPDENKLSVEYVCIPCGNKYLFCSECGGGGKVRTGKWRPMELFQKGKRTCSLPHVRIGTAPLSTKVIEYSLVDPAILGTIQDIYFDCRFSLLSTPSNMESPNYGSFLAIKASILNSWKSNVLDWYVSPTDPGVHRFLVIQSMVKPARFKNKGVSSLAKEASRLWFKKLDLPEISHLQGVNLKSEPRPKPIEDDDDTFHVTFGMFEWDTLRKTLLAGHIVPRSVYSRPLETYSEMLQAGVEHVYSEAQKRDIEVPIYITCRTSADYTRTNGPLKRLGFVPKQEFLSANPELDSDCLSHDEELLNSSEGSASHVISTEKLINNPNFQASISV